MISDITLGIPDSDKGLHYLRLYERFFAGLRAQPVRLLELGVAGGGSLRYWAEYFPKGQIVGLDRQVPAIGHPRIRAVEGDQEDPAALARCGDTFDIVIDDCAHIARSARASFLYLFPRMRTGGIYAIEDWGTGYWGDWPDGAQFESHHYAGMVGFIKDLVDSVAADDIARKSVHNSPASPTNDDFKVESLTIINGLAIAVKA
jgi:SAM-dependent methyltransferase